MPDFDKPGPPPRRVGRALQCAVSVLLSGVCLPGFGCSAEVPREAALRDEIAIGPYSLEILRARRAPTPPPPISTFRSQPGKKGVVVSVHWRKLDDVDGMSRMAFIEKFLEGQLSIADSEGQRAEPTGAMYESLMFMQDPGSNWRDWVVVFYVSDESQHLRLLVENPEPREGQPRLTAVPLQM